MKTTSAKYREIVLHFVFTPKYRHPVFTNPQVAYRLEQLLKQASLQLGLEVLALATQPDHVHVLLWPPRTVTTAEVAQRLKWWSSLKLRQEFPHLTDDRALWGRDYFVRSVGSRASVKKYIEDQGLTPIAHQEV